MKNNLFNTSPNQKPEKTVKKLSRKKLYLAIASTLAIVIIVATAVSVPQGNANVISLGVSYKVGEKLTYDTTTTMASNSSDPSTTYSQDSTVTIEVVSFNEGIYKINYTEITNYLGSSIAISHLANVKESQMVTALALLPMALQESSWFGNGNDTDPFMSAFFDQTTAKVGDTWKIPLTAANSSKLGDLSVTFKAIQDLHVAAGNYRVFRMDLSSYIQVNGGYVIGSMDISGTAYLQEGSCKQVQSNLQLTMSQQFGLDISISNTVTITCSLTKDQMP
jgi:hypothetical protein